MEEIHIPDYIQNEIKLEISACLPLKKASVTRFHVWEKHTNPAKSLRASFETKARLHASFYSGALAEIQHRRLTPFHAESITR